MHLVSPLEWRCRLRSSDEKLDGLPDAWSARREERMMIYWITFGWSTRSSQQEDPIQLTSHTRNIRLSDSNNLHKSGRREEPDNTPGALDEDDDQHSTTTARLLIIMLLSLLLHRNLLFILCALKLLLSFRWWPVVGFSISTLWISIETWLRLFSIILMAYQQMPIMIMSSPHF